MYQMVVYKYTGPIPSDVETALQYYWDNAIAGVKTRYPAWG